MKQITVIGGGVAGLAVGIGLRRLGVPVELFEAGQYPRHKVCGEFLSGRGQAVLSGMGFEPKLQAGMSRRALTGAFFAGRNSSGVRFFPEPALCVPRYVLDHAMAQSFQELGGVLHVGRRFNEPENRSGIVWATGRRPRLAGESSRWVGLKAHATGVPLAADLEMHAVEDGYVGLCALPDGIVNVCGVFRKCVGMHMQEPIERLRGDQGSVLWQRLAHAVFHRETFCAVAGLGWARELRQDRCCLGDALVTTPPVTGNGMSIALETAGLALEPLTQFSAGQIGWEEARNEVYRRCRAALSWRLRWAGLLHRALTSAPVRGRAGRVALRSDLLWNIMFSATRSLPSGVAHSMISSGTVR